MTSADTATGDEWLEENRPRLRPSVRVGPALWEGPRRIHVVGDLDTGLFLRVGEREAFLISRLDGGATLNEIGDEYARRFGRRLAADHWHSLLGLLEPRGLLVGADPEVLDRVRASAASARRAEGRSPLRWRLPLPGAVERVPTVAKTLGWLFAPAMVVPLSLAGLLVCAYVIFSWRELYAAFAGSSSWSSTLVSVLLLWAVVCAHEYGHAVVCHRYGGRATEIGLMWRLPLIALYCKTDEQVLFPRAWQRVMTSFAGVHVNLMAMIPIAALWWWGPDTGWWHGTAAALMSLGTVATLVNLLPVLGLDGYHMVEHGLSTMHLQRQTVRFVRSVLTGRAAEYPRRARLVYSGYALLALAILGSMVVGLLGVWYVTLAEYWGPFWAVSTLLAEGLLLVVVVWWLRRRGKEA